MIKIKRLKSRKKTEINPLMIILGIILALYSLSIIVSLFWGLITSFKDNFGDFYTNKLGFPKEWLFSNYISAFEHFEAKVQTIDGGYKWCNFLDMFKNSLLYAVGCSFFSTFIPCITGYAMAKFKFRFSNFLYIVVLMTMALPIVGNLASEINVVRSIGLYDTFISVWIMSANFAGQFTLVFYAAFKGISDGYSEAAEIDGASEFGIMIRIMIPLVINTFGAIMLIRFITYWNEYESAMIYLKSHPTIAYGLWSFNNDTVRGMNGVPMKLTGCMILLMPVLVIFLIFQDKLMGNVSMGGLKG